MFIYHTSCVERESGARVVGKDSSKPRGGGGRGSVSVSNEINISFVQCFTEKFERNGAWVDAPLASTLHGRFIVQAQLLLPTPLDRGAVTANNRGLLGRADHPCTAPCALEPMVQPSPAAAPVATFSMCWYCSRCRRRASRLPHGLEGPYTMLS